MLSKLGRAGQPVIVPLKHRWLITLAITALVIVLSLVPDQRQPGDSGFAWLISSTPMPVQKVMHVLLYAALTFLLAWSLEKISRRYLRFAVALFLASALGVVLEWLQTMIPGRFGTIADVLLNTVGAVLGLVATTILL